MYVYEEYVSHGTKIYSIFYNNKFDSMEHLFYTWTNMTLFYNTAIGKLKWHF
jgi:hypothetical protein